MNKKLKTTLSLMAMILFIGAGAFMAYSELLYIEPIDKVSNLIAGEYNVTIETKYDYVDGDFSGDILKYDMKYYEESCKGTVVFDSKNNMAYCVFMNATSLRPYNISYDSVYEVKDDLIKWKRNETVGSYHNSKNVTFNLLSEKSVLNYKCDYYTFGNCKINDKADELICDSKYDGNGDGVCQSGESCYTIYITKEGIKKVKNEGFNEALSQKSEVNCKII